MTAADVLNALLKTNLASGAAILAVVALRKTARTRFGARLAYGLWLLPVLTGAAVLLPARQVVVVRSAAPMLSAAIRIGHGLESPSATAGLNVQSLLVGLWLAGVFGAALAMAVLQHRFIERARRGGVGPAVVGLIVPRILIPRDFAERYSAPEQALVLAHEQAHLARQDFRLNGLMAALQCLSWFNPLVHLAARLMRVDQELACDEAVVRRFPDARRAYAEVLMKAQMAVLPLPLGCYWPSRSQHPLVERVAMLKRPRVGRARWRAGAFALGCLWAGVGLAAWASQPAQVRTMFKAAPAPALPSKVTPPDGQTADAAANPGDTVRAADVQAKPAAPSSAVPNGGASVDPAPQTPTVEDEGISSRDLGRRMKQVAMLSGVPITTEQLPALREQALKSLNTERAKSQADAENQPGPISFTAARLNRFDEQHRVEFAGDVETVQDGRRVVSDLLNIYSYGPGEPGGPGLKEAKWEGHVLVDRGDDAARADRAVYDAGSNTMTLSGHVVIVRGAWVVKNDQLVIDLKDR